VAQGADGQRVQPQHDQDDGHGHEHRGRREQQVGLARSRQALIVQHHQGRHRRRAGGRLGGSADEYCAAWLPLTAPLITRAVPVAVTRLCRTARGRARPANTASALASAAAASVVRAAAMITGRWAFVRGHRGESPVSAIGREAYASLPMVWIGWYTRWPAGRRRRIAAGQNSFTSVATDTCGQLRLTRPVGLAGLLGTSIGKLSSTVWVYWSCM